MPQGRSSGRTGTACSRAARFTTNSLREVQAMSGLEKRKCDPLAGARQWAAKRTAFQQLKEKGVLYFENEGKNKGCWVMTRPTLSKTVDPTFSPKEGERSEER